MRLRAAIPSRQQRVEDMATFEDVSLVPIEDTHREAWEEWVPSTTNITLADGELDAAYQWLSVTTCNFRFDLTFGASTAFAGTPLIELPFVPQGGGAAAAAFIDLSGLTAKVGVLQWGALNATASLVSDVGFVNATTPFTWAVGDIIRVGAAFEIATDV